MAKDFMRFEGLKVTFNNFKGFFNILEDFAKS